MPRDTKPLELTARPTDVDLEGFVNALTKEPSVVPKYVWTAPSNERFVISLRQLKQGGELEWQLFRLPEMDSPLWSLTTSDVTEVYTKIIKTTGEDLEEAIKCDLKTTRQRLPTYKKREELNTTFEGDKKSILNELEKLKVEQESALSGELSLVHITNVLQSISMARISGRLSIDASEKQVDIFFVGGAPVHAIGTIGDGRECLIRTIGLEEGRFHFDLAMRTDQKSITESLESLILAGVKLVDNTRFLTELGLVNDSVLVRTNPSLSELQFESLIGNCPPGTMSMFKSFYLVIDNVSAFRDLLRRVGFPRSKWVEIVSTLIRSKLIAIKSANEVRFSRKQLDPQIISTFKKQVTVKETGLLSYPAFLFLLGHEVYRADLERPLSVMLFELASDTSNEMLPHAVLEGIVWLINEIKRPVDLLGHYEEKGLAMALPNMKSKAAAALAERIAETVTSHPLIRSVEIRNVKMAFGIATLPTDVDDVLSVLAAAELAREESRTRAVPIVLAQDLTKVRN